MEIINAKGDEGELAEIVDQNKLRTGQSRAFIQDEALVIEEEKE